MERYNNSTFNGLSFASLNHSVNVFYAFDKDFVSEFDVLSDKSAADWMDEFIALISNTFVDISLTGYIRTTVTIRGTTSTMEASFQREF